MSRPSILFLAALFAALGGCTDDIALLDALPGTWEQESDGSLIEFTRSPTPIAVGGSPYQGRAVTSGGGLVDLVRSVRDDCASAGEIGFVWAVVDTSKYGNVGFALDPDFSSPTSSAACQSGGSVSFEYPVLRSEARRFTIGTPEVEFIGLEEEALETFRAVALDIFGPTEPRPDGGTGAVAFGAGLGERRGVVFYNFGASQVVNRALQPIRSEVPSNLTLTGGSSFDTIATDDPRAVWDIQLAGREGGTPYAHLINQTVAASHALETWDGTNPSAVSATSPDGLFTGQMIRFEDAGTCADLGITNCPSPSSQLVRIFSLFVQDGSSPPADPVGARVLTYDAGASQVLAEPRDPGNGFQLWIVQELR